MKHTKIIMKEHGSKIKIQISLYISQSQAFSYSTAVYFCANHNNEFSNVVDRYHVDRVKLDVSQRVKWDIQKQLLYTTKEEINLVKLELWEMIKPKINHPDVVIIR